MRDLPVITWLGGGGASFVTHPFQGNVHVNYGVPTADKGGSTRYFATRSELPIPPPGDIRRAIINGVPGARRHLVRNFLEHRFPNCHGNHALGNILLDAAIQLANGDVNLGIEEFARFAGAANWNVYPATLVPIDVKAELADGRTLNDECEIDTLCDNDDPQCVRIKRAWLEPGEVAANPKLVQAILDSDVVVMGPTDHFTSLLPILMVSEIAAALRTTSATRIYVANLMTKPNETHEYDVAKFVEDIEHYCGGNVLDHVIVNTAKIPREARMRYAQMKQYLVQLRGIEDVWGSPKVIEADLIMQDGDYIRHDPIRLMAVILDICPLLRKYI